MKKRKYSSPYFGRDYFSRDILPHSIYAGHKTIRQSIPYRRHDEIVFLLIRDGEGTVTVNGHVYPVRRGSLFCFSPHHFHKIDVEKGHSLEVCECHMNTGLYLYVTACPYYPVRSDVPAPPVFASLDAAGADRTDRLMEDISAQCDKGPVSENQVLYFLLMKLFGILEHYAPTT